jgi:hypothetical protein
MGLNGIYLEVIWDKSWDKNVELYGIFHDHFSGIKSWDFMGSFLVMVILGFNGHFW